MNYMSYKLNTICEAVGSENYSGKRKSYKI